MNKSETNSLIFILASKFCSTKKLSSFKKQKSKLLTNLSYQCRVGAKDSP